MSTRTNGSTKVFTLGNIMKLLRSLGRCRVTSPRDPILSYETITQCESTNKILVCMPRIIEVFTRRANCESLSARTRELALKKIRLVTNYMLECECIHNYMNKWNITILPEHTYYVYRLFREICDNTLAAKYGNTSKQQCYNMACEQIAQYCRKGTLFENLQSEDKEHFIRWTCNIPEVRAITDRLDKCEATMELTPLECLRLYNSNNIYLKYMYNTKNMIPQYM